ncbi:uncharacterized protein LOC123471079 isoform X1 [Daphnia magna]|uniref:uncharacterized protein LOC123471079 isoform X1 n=1 Tax=Daphnia magna TaxID=35525 RepID=UPI001E1BAF3C|nr:uncharacterized protein LOC123471079 isoform X1 [Daphnia magna]
MENSSKYTVYQLDHSQIQQILYVSGKKKRKWNSKSGGAGLSRDYSRALKRQATDILLKWKKNGVPPEEWNKLNDSSSNVAAVFSLVQKTCDVSAEVFIGRSEISSNFVANDQASSTTVNQCTSATYLDERADWDYMHQQMVNPEESIIGNESLTSEEDDSSSMDGEQVGDDESPILLLLPHTIPMKMLSFKRLLQYHAVYTTQKKSHVTYFLRLRHHYRPAIDYDTLPTTGEQLLRVESSKAFIERVVLPNIVEDEEAEITVDSYRIYNGSPSPEVAARPGEAAAGPCAVSAIPNTATAGPDAFAARPDVPAAMSDRSAARSVEPAARSDASAGVPDEGIDFRRERRPVRKLSPVIYHLDDKGEAKYVHFGLENGITRDSPGVFFKHAELIQYASIYKKHQDILPPSITKKINRFDENEQILHVKRLLRADGHNAGISSSAQPASTTPKKLPHFTIDLNADGVQLFQSSEKNKCIPIMMVVHSVKEQLFPTLLL